MAMRNPISGSRNLKAALAYLAVYLGWGTTYLAIRMGVSKGDWEPAEFQGVRFLIAAFVLSPILFVRSAPGSRSPARWAHSALQGFLILFGGLLPVAYAQKLIPSSVTAIIIGCAPIQFAFFDRLLNGTPIRKTVIAGFALGLAGILLLVLDRPAAGGPSEVTGGGLALVIAGSLSWTFGSVLAKRLKPCTNSLMHVFVQYLAVGVLLMAFSFRFEAFSLAKLPPFPSSAWHSLLYIALFPSLISYTSYMWLLRNEPSSRVSTYAFVNPVVAVIAGAAILHERVSPNIVGALALVLVGTWCNFQKPKSPAGG